MANKFHIEMITPDGKKIEDDIEILNVVTSSGALGVMAHHIPLIAIVEISHLNYKKDGKSYDFAIAGGVLNVKKEGVTLLADGFETKEEIDVERATRAKERAEERLSSKQENIDYKRAEIALKKAINRLSI